MLQLTFSRLRIRKSKVNFPFEVISGYVRLKKSLRGINLLLFQLQIKESIIDITLLCGSRPSLLELTLASFSHHVFRFFNISEVFVNIDLFGGGSEIGKNVSRLFVHTSQRQLYLSPPETVLEGHYKSFGAFQTATTFFIWKTTGFATVK